MIVKQMAKRKSEKELTFSDPLDQDSEESSMKPDTIEELSDVDKIEKDSEYSEHVEKSEEIDELEDGEETKSKEELEDIEKKLILNYAREKMSAERNQKSELRSQK